MAMFSTVWAQSRRSSSQSASPSLPGLSTWNSGGSSSRDIPKSNLGAEGEGPRPCHEPAVLPALPALPPLVYSVPTGFSPHLTASHKTNLPHQERQQGAGLVGDQQQGHKKPFSAPQTSRWALAQLASSPPMCTWIRRAQRSGWGRAHPHRSWARKTSITRTMSTSTCSGREAWGEAGASML